MKIISTFFLVFFLGATSLLYSQREFNLERYQQFRAENSDMSADDLLRRYSSGTFESRGGVPLSDACFGDSIGSQYGITNLEKSRIEQNGFVVTERLSYESFGQPLLEIFKKDLPVFVSTDAILHALHMSYDRILKDMETHVLLPHFQQMLMRAHNQLHSESYKYRRATDKTFPTAAMQVSMRDVDLYLAVALSLLNGTNVMPAYPENVEEVSRLLALIDAETPAEYPLFVSPKSKPRLIDFSQFTPRGHYTTSEELTRYFKTLIWLGRTEIYLTPPTAAYVGVKDEDKIRQMIDACLIVDLLNKSNALQLWTEADDMIDFFVGESDNLTPLDLQAVIEKAGIKSPSDLLYEKPREQFIQALKEVPNPGQAILSQLLVGGPLGAPQVEPSTAFLLFGQRFIVDSYVLSNVVYDRVSDPRKPPRMFPSTLDVLFALGNNVAAPLLSKELDTYGYAPNLAGVRYLIDSYDESFWNGTFYGSWINILRTLNPPSSKERSTLPRFMQTEAWWRQKMNTQLASWAELRHDNILYAKQSYTAMMITCSYPKSLVEPIPKFYHRVAGLAKRAQKKFINMRLANNAQYMAANIGKYFEVLEKTCDTLAVIAEKELRQETLSDEEIVFLRSMIRKEETSRGGGCGGPIITETQYDGWYPQLFYAPGNREIVMEKDFIVADVHTVPTDSEGRMIGAVIHAGTGPINMAVITCQSPDGSSCAYIGPVMSYYQHTTRNFQRLTDEKWVEMHTTGLTQRPAWTQTFLVGKQE